MLSDQIVPQLVLDIMNEKLGLLGHLVIDSTINGHSAGGIRMLPDATVEEAMLLARNMTLKHGFWGIPVGGAKSCITASSTTSEGRAQILSAFGKSLSPLIKSKIYYPGLDMGVGESDLQCVLKAAGLKTNPSKESAHTHIGTEVYSSWTVLASAKVAANRAGLDLTDCSVAIEGFGKLGSSIAEVFSEEGAKIVAVSTVKGAIYDSAGFDIGKLVKARNKFGDELVEEYNRRKIEKSDLLRLPVDILVPCARPWSINTVVAGEIKSKIVCPGANAPVTMEAEKILHDREILCIPDFVANSGGAFASHIRIMASQEKMRQIVDKEFSRKVLGIICLAEERNLPPGEVARDVAIKGFQKTKLEAEKDALEKSVVKSIFKLLPESVRKTLAPIYFRRRLQLSQAST